MGESLKFQLNLKPTVETKTEDKFPAITQLEKLEVETPKNGPKSAYALFTPGGTFQLTPLVKQPLCLTFLFLKVNFSKLTNSKKSFLLCKPPKYPVKTTNS